MRSVSARPSTEMQPQPRARWWRSAQANTLLLALLLAAVTCALYYPVSSHPFLNYDDTLYVTDNEHVQAGLTWATARWALTTFDVGIWHPLTWLSHALDCQIYGLDPAGHHDTNLLLHVCNVVLLFWVLQQATGFAGRSAMVAALFGLHPVNVESVAWIAERKNLLSMVFFLLALGAYRWYARGPRVGRYLWVAFLYGLGLVAKPQVITLPCVLLLWDYWPLQRMFASAHETPCGTEPGRALPGRSLYWLIGEKVPLFALSAGSAFMTMKALSADVEKVWYPRSIRIENAIISYVQYLGKAFWPSRLAIFYPHPGSSLRLWQASVALLFLFAITALVLEARPRRFLVVGWLWFLGTLVPMIGLAPVGYQGMQGMADRYGYLPFVGLFIMICWGAAVWAQRRHITAAWLAYPALATLLALAVVTHRQISYWSDNVSLWSHAVQVTSGNFLAENNLGRICMNEGREREGIEHFLRAAAAYPSDPVSNLNIGTYELMHGDSSEAIVRFRTAIRGSRDASLQAQAFRQMGQAYQNLGDSVHAQQCFAMERRLKQ